MPLQVAMEAAAQTSHQQQQQQPLLLLPETISSDYGNTPTNRNAQRTLFRVMLLLAVWAVISTVISTTSGNVIFQVLSQTQLVQAAAQTSSKHIAKNATVIVHEPYGYVSVEDDIRMRGRMRYLYTAAFYEYRLPRAVLKDSLHRENITIEESKELLFKAGFRKRPKDWKPTALSSNRSVFLDEPYRDRTIDRIFKRSHRMMNTGLMTGILAVLGLVVLTCMIGSGSNESGYSKKERHKPTTTMSLLQTLYRDHFRCPKKAGDWLSIIASKKISKPFVRCIRTPLVVLVIVIGLMIVAAINPASAIVLLRFNNVFCGKQCASSSLSSKTTIEIDACIETCVLGTGGKFALLASGTWFLVLVLVVALTIISALARMPKASSYLSKKKVWNKYCLLLAIKPEQLFSFPRRVLPSLHEQNKGGQQQLHKQ